MNITFSCAHIPAQPWLEGLRAALPQASVTEWAPGAPAADMAVVWRPSQQFVDEQTGLKAMFNIGAGVDAVLQLRLPPTLKLVRLDDAGMGAQMAEYVCHAVVRHFRDLDAYQADAGKGIWLQRPPRVRRDFAVGVMGLGVLGERVARALRQFEFPVHGWSRSPRSVEGVTCHAGPGGFQSFLSSCQVLVNLLPLTADTRDILNRDTLSQLRPGAYLVNVARGAHLVEEDLLALLDSGHLAGATLDVFRAEPLPVEHPFWKHPHITVTPHISASTLREESIAQIAGKILAFERGEAVVGLVDPVRGY